MNSYCVFKCINKLPSTISNYTANNPVEKIFWGRASIKSASAQYYFTKNSILQHILHQLKYKGKKEIGIYFGRMMVKRSVSRIVLLILMLLYHCHYLLLKKEEEGYNQANVLAEGISSVTKLPILDNCIERITATETQTQKNRIERWQNISGKFKLEGSKK